MTQRQYLDCTEGVQQMRIMPLRSPKASIGVLTGQHPIDNALCIHHVLLAQEMHGCEAPVNPRHAEVLCGVEFECVLPLHMWSGFSAPHQKGSLQAPFWNVPAHSHRYILRAFPLAALFGYQADSSRYLSCLMLALGPSLHR